MWSRYHDIPRLSEISGSCGVKSGGILGDAPGYGKTATMIGLIDASAGTRDCQLHLPAESDPYFFKSRATLAAGLHATSMCKLPLSACEC